LLALYEYNAVIEALLHQMNFEVFSEHFNLASQVVIRTFNELEFALVLMLLEVLPQKTTSTLVFALNYLEKTALIVGSMILEHQ
jgi:predicted transcriptional regulator